MVLVFDLDDTLYAEKSFVYSGFDAVAEFISSEYNIKKHIFSKELKLELQNGRGNVFDTVLKDHNLFSKELVKKIISIYRLHKPIIQVYDDTIECLHRFSDIPKYIVTDGNKIVQENKIKSLDIEQYFLFCFISRRYGIHNEKPSPYCFQKICKLEETTPQNIVYIGDNPTKDFIGIKPLGFKTIRIMKGSHKNIVKTHEYEAHFQINSLSELTPHLLERLFV
ncbi:MAG: HAD-IA family hydrolase [Bacteroidia bacterium]|nr:HAD-IA family hydrolase [Bacteroidia bacterium]